MLDRLGLSHSQMLSVGPDVPTRRSRARFLPTRDARPVEVRRPIDGRMRFEVTALRAAIAAVDGAHYDVAVGAARLRAEINDVANLHVAERSRTAAAALSGTPPRL